MRVAHLTEAPKGGVLSYLEELINEQVKCQEITSIISVMPAVNADTFATTVHKKVDLRTFNHTRGSLIGLLQLGLQTLKVLIADRPDVIHIHSTFAGVICRLCCVVTNYGGCVVYCPHGWSFARSSSFKYIYRRLERFLSRISDKIVCISDHEKEEAILAGIKASKCVVIRNGIGCIEGNDSVQSARSTGRSGLIKVLFVGRFDHQKGFDIFLDALGRLDGRAVGMAVGDFLVSSPGKGQFCPANVTVLGWRNRHQLLGLYQEADVLLVPSRWEGFGLVAIEAMRSRLAVFASNVGGLSEIVKDRETGRVFDVGRVDQIVRLITESSRDELVRYGNNGYVRFAQEYSSVRMSREVIDLYKTC